MSTITIHTFGHYNSIYEIAEGTGECSDELAGRLSEILGLAIPVSLSGLPESFSPCGNPLADIAVLDEAGHDFELVEAEEDEGSSFDDPYPFILPVEALDYFRKYR